MCSAYGQKNRLVPTPATNAHWSISQITDVSRASLSIRAAPARNDGADAARGSVRVIRAGTCRTRSLVRQGGDAGQHFALQKLERSAAAGRNVAHLVGHAR